VVVDPELNAKEWTAKKQTGELNALEYLEVGLMHVDTHGNVRTGASGEPGTHSLYVHLKQSTKNSAVNEDRAGRRRRQALEAYCFIN